MTDEQQLKTVWVFTGWHSSVPSGIFTKRELAEAWIHKHGLSGTLRAFPIDVPLYDWTIEMGYFKPKKAEQATPHFIANFSPSASMEHYHYD